MIARLASLPHRHPRIRSVREPWPRPRHSSFAFPFSNRDRITPLAAPTSIPFSRVTRMVGAAAASISAATIASTRSRNTLRDPLQQNRQRHVVTLGGVIEKRCNPRFASRSIYSRAIAGIKTTTRRHVADRRWRRRFRRAAFVAQFSFGTARRSMLVVRHSIQPVPRPTNGDANRVLCAVCTFFPHLVPTVHRFAHYALHASPSSRGGPLGATSGLGSPGFRHARSRMPRRPPRTQWNVPLPLWCLYGIITPPSLLFASFTCCAFALSQPRPSWGLQVSGFAVDGCCGVCRSPQCLTHHASGRTTTVVRRTHSATFWVVHQGQSSEPPQADPTPEISFTPAVPLLRLLSTRTSAPTATETSFEVVRSGSSPCLSIRFRPCRPSCRAPWASAVSAPVTQ